MMYLKSVLVGFGTLLLGCALALVAMMMWWTRRSSTGNKAGPGETLTVSFSPMGLESHMAHSVLFWVFIIGLFSAGFLTSLCFLRRRRLSGPRQL